MLIVLVHGSWHQGELWEPVAAILRNDGHTIHTPTIAGHGKGATRAGVTHADCVASITNYIRQHDLRDFVLLGHSFAGTIIGRVAEEVPDRIRRLVYWNAFVLLDGQSLNDNVPQVMADTFVNLARETPDNSVMMPFPIWRELFIQDGDLAMAQRSYEMLSPIPIASFTDKVPMRSFYDLPIPKSYINCTEDNALGAGGWHPTMSTRLGLFRLVQMPGSHEAMFTKPALLAEKIVEAARD
jgi:pimeloyl-ACP methyl ester carboxylesterase